MEQIKDIDIEVKIEVNISHLLPPEDRKEKALREAGNYRINHQVTKEFAPIIKDYILESMRGYNEPPYISAKNDRISL